MSSLDRKVSVCKALEDQPHADYVLFIQRTDGQQLVLFVDEWSTSEQPGLTVFWRGQEKIATLPTNYPFYVIHRDSFDRMTLAEFIKRAVQEERDKKELVAANSEPLGNDLFVLDERGGRA